MGGGCHKTLAKARLGQASESGLGIENCRASEELFLRSCRGLVSFPGGSVGKESACNAGNAGLIPGLGSSLEEEMATHSSILAGRIPWTEEPVNRVTKSQP